MTAPLQMLLDEGIGLYYRCPNILPDGRVCGNEKVLDAEPLAKCYGGYYPIQHVALDIICDKCGHRKVEVQPDWPSKGPGVIVKAVP